MSDGPIAPGERCTVVALPQMACRLCRFVVPEHARSSAWLVRFFGRPVSEPAFAIEEIRVGGRVLSGHEITALDFAEWHLPMRGGEPMEIDIRNLAEPPHALLRWWHRRVLIRWGRGRWRVFRAAAIVATGPVHPALDVLTGAPSSQLLSTPGENAVLEFSGTIPPGEDRDLGGAPTVLFRPGRLAVFEGAAALVVNVTVTGEPQFVSDSAIPAHLFAGGVEPLRLHLPIAPPGSGNLTATFHNPTPEPLRVRGAFFGLTADDAPGPTAFDRAVSAVGAGMLDGDGSE